MMNVINFILANWQAMLAALIALLVALIGVFMLIPGEQPEKTLQKIVDFLTKFSIKKEAAQVEEKKE